MWDTEADRGPLEYFTVGPGTPLGSYTLNCRLDNAQSGVTISVDQAVFQVE